MINWYPVCFEEFLRVKRVGNYTITYAILDDRIHLEMAIENAVFITQKFLASLKEEMKEKAENYSGDEIDYFLQTYVGENIAYRFYPDDEYKEKIMLLKLYSRLVVKEINNENNDGSPNKVIEYDDKIITYNDDYELIMSAEKVK